VPTDVPAADDEVPVKRARIPKDFKYLKVDGEYHCEHCKFRADSHRGMANHMTRSHKDKDKDKDPPFFRGRRVFVARLMSVPGFKEDVAKYLGEPSILTYINMYQRPMDKTEKEELLKVILEELKPAVMNAVESRKARDGGLSVDTHKCFFNFAWADVMQTAEKDAAPICMVRALTSSIKRVMVKSEV
jgi:hypothetical protein